MNKYSFHVQGTHCNSCKILIEDVLVEKEGISTVRVNLHRQLVEVEGDMKLSPEELIKVLNPLLESHKYSLSMERQMGTKDYKALSIALPIGLAVLFLFFLLQKSGIINLGFEGKLTPLTAFFIGIVASLSTCLAVVGGLILSLSAKVSQETRNFRPFALFHSGRIVGFALLGALLGALGGALAINQMVSVLLGLFAALVMIILGINLLNIFHFAKKLQITLPKSFFQKITNIEKGFWAPVATGVATFFLPCGFTQSMQIASLVSGSWFQGGVTMLMFSLGTLPMLLLISFSSYKFAHSKYASIFYKSAGIVVIGLGIFAFLGGLATLGIIKPLFNL